VYKPTNLRGHTFLPTNLSCNSVVLDVGANFGEFSAEVHQCWGCKVYCVEPTPSLAEELRNHHWIVHEAAMSASGESQMFYVDHNNTEASHLGANDGDGDMIAVEGIKLDDLLLEAGEVDLLKMDIEGAEIGVLLNVDAALLKLVKQITVEFHDFRSDMGVDLSDVQEVESRLLSLGFRKFKISHSTNGDVLFVNARFFELTMIDSFLIMLLAKWVPGVIKVLRRSLSSHSSP
jgi:FkbM family methyltransferase